MKIFFEIYPITHVTYYFYPHFLCVYSVDPIFT